MEPSRDREGALAMERWCIRVGAQAIMMAKMQWSEGAIASWAMGELVDYTISEPNVALFEFTATWGQWS